MITSAGGIVNNWGCSFWKNYGGSVEKKPSQKIRENRLFIDPPRTVFWG
jgi:hypothetical protein